VGKSFEEVYRENQALMQFAINRFGYNVEPKEAWQIASLGLWRASQWYKEGKAKWNTYAIRIIKHALITRRAYQGRKMRASIPLSMDMVVAVGDGKDALKLHEVRPEFRVEAQDKGIEKEQEREALLAALKRLPKKKRELVLQYNAGHTFEEIAKERKMTRQNANRIWMESMQALHRMLRNDVRVQR
jgi:RNA polymerase sigma factor (sigma-70 family)